MTYWLVNPSSANVTSGSEDRQLLLDAIGAAGEKLVITYTGADEYTGQRHPPCVPLAEILDALDGTTAAPVRGARAGEASTATVRYP